MACSRNKKWYLLSPDNKMVWAENRFGDHLWMRKYKGTPIVIFRSLSHARDTAKKQGGVVAYLSLSVSDYYHT